jgi:hypothetical protein
MDFFRFDFRGFFVFHLRDDNFDQFNSFQVIIFFNSSLKILLTIKILNFIKNLLDQLSESVFRIALYKLLDNKLNGAKQFFRKSKTIKSKRKLN